MRALFIASMLTVIPGCGLLPQGDSAVYSYIWNRSESDLTVRVGVDQARSCRRLDAGALGEAYGQTGEYGPRLRLYDQDEAFVSELEPASDHALFIIGDGGAVQQVEVGTRQVATRDDIQHFFVAPEIPELDGRPLPDELPITREGWCE